MQGEPSEKCGEINFSLDYDFNTQTLKLKIIQVSWFIYCIVLCENVIFGHGGENLKQEFYILGHFLQYKNFNKLAASKLPKMQ